MNALFQAFHLGLNLRIPLPTYRARGAPAAFACLDSALEGRGPT